jgi:predicted nucleic acid-binding protein
VLKNGRCPPYVAVFSVNPPEQAPICGFINTRQKSLAILLKICTIVHIRCRRQVVEIAIDASAVIAVIANESVKARLVDVTQGADLIAPASIHWEIGNAFSAMLKRGRVSLDQALEAISLYYLIPIRFVEVDLHESLRIAAERGIYAYDAYLIRCALKYDVPLLTLDNGLAQSAQACGARVIEVTA